MSSVLNAIGVGTGSVINKGIGSEVFSGGEVAWTLQNRQTKKDDNGGIIQIWRQNLSNTAADDEASNKDDYPVLTSDAEKAVHKVSFMVTDSKSESGYKEIAAKYVNHGKVLADNMLSEPTADMFNKIKSETEKSSILKRLEKVKQKITHIFVRENYLFRQKVLKFWDKWCIMYLVGAIRC